VSIQAALDQLFVTFDEVEEGSGKSRATGSVRLGKAFEGPPGRLHGGLHMLVRTLPVLARLRAHDPARTFPCTLDVDILKALPLEQEIPFEARYTSDADGYRLTTRFDGTDRLLAHAHGIEPAERFDAAERARWKAVYEAARHHTDGFELLGVPIHLAPEMVWVEVENPRGTRPESQMAGIAEEDGSLGPPFFCTSLDMVGAVARGTYLRHPHFTKHMELTIEVESVPPDEPVLALADRTTMREDPESTTAKVELQGTLYGTYVVPVALFDCSFSRVYAHGTVTVHPVDPAKFERLTEMKQLRQV